MAMLLSAVTKLLTGATPRWIGCEPSPRQRIYYANHGSHLDAVVLWSALPPCARRAARPIAARDYWERTAFRRYLAERVFNALLIDRSRPRSDNGEVRAGRGALQAIEDMADTLAAGDSLIIFPEGTRGSGESIAPFKAGLHHLAKRHPGVELVPVYLENLNRILPKGELLPVPFLSSITFGRPIHVEEGEEKAAFLERARAAIQELKSV